MAEVKPIPEGYHSVTPYLTVHDAAKLLAFVKEAFGAEETVMMPGPNGKIGHAEVRIGDSMVMMGDASLGEFGAMNGMVLVYVDDVDKTYAKAIEAGAKSLREPKDEFYGDRTGGVEDPTGNRWWISTHIEDVPPEEMDRRAREWAQQQAQG
jgi:PhnB protein